MVWYVKGLLTSQNLGWIGSNKQKYWNAANELDPSVKSTQSAFKWIQPAGQSNWLGRDEIDNISGLNLVVERQASAFEMDGIAAVF